MLKEEVSIIFEDIATLLELNGENPFKIRAYEAAAHAISNLDDDLEKLIREGRLKEIKGIGDAIAAKIIEYFQTGAISYYERLKADLPKGLIELLKVPGLGPKKIHTLYTALGIADISELENACLENRLIDLPGFGLKSQEKILRGLTLLKEHQGMFLYSDAVNIAEKVIKEIQNYSEKISYAGSIRRFKEIVKDIDLVAVSKNKDKLIDAFVSLSQIESIIQKGDNKASIVTKEGINIDLLVVDMDEYAYALHHFTGSKEHNVLMRSYAKSLGLKINEFGVFKEDQRVSAADENEFFAIFGMDYIPPEIREGTNEIDAALNKHIPRLVEAKDIQGLFHMHTAYSDGLGSIRDLREAAKGLGLSYIGISDHSQTASYAGGLKFDALKRQAEEIRLLNEEDPSFKIFHGIESDILPDGSLDYPDEILAMFDFVIGSVHSRFKMSEREMTSRIIKALKNKYLTILGHPSGRLLLTRAGYSINLEEILITAAEYGKCIEINSNPHRLDLDWHWCRRAKEMGIKLVISPDAHHVTELRNYLYGIQVARKGWLTKDDVLNTFSLPEITKYLTR